MRGVLASVVMLSHFGLNTLLGRLSGGVIDNANWGLCVDFFFMLSGFVLCCSYHARKVGVREYLTKRMFRLAPMYYLTFVIAIPVAPVPLTLGTTAANALMVQPYLGLSSTNVPSWSIPYEMFLPLLILMIAPLAARWRRGALVAAFALFVVGAVGATIAAEVLKDFETISRPVFGLGAGALLYLLFRLSAPAPSRLRTYLAFGAAFTAMALSHWGVVAHAAFVVACLAAIYFGAPTASLFSGKVAQAFGRWSYSIYLIHFQVMNTSVLLFGEPKTGGVAIKIAWVLITIACAAAAYRWIEKPMIERGAGYWRCHQERLRISGAPSIQSA